MNKCTLIVNSCDSYEDTWYPFFKLLKKYWPNLKYDIVLNTETKRFSYEGLNIRTIKATSKINQIWSNRLYNVLKKINTEFVIIMCDDFFIREPVDQKRIDYCINNFDKDTATFNFEKTYSCEDINCSLEGFKLRPDNSTYRLSCQAGIWNRIKLMELLDCNMNPWEWETSNPKNNYKFYINCGNFIINYGYENHKWMGICKGKWVINDVKPLFKKENINIDFNLRNKKKDFRLCNKIINKAKATLKKTWFKNEN